MSVTTERNRENTSAAGQNVRVTRWVATTAGLIGFVLSVATPLLPVVQTTATLSWPQNGQLNSVTAPLISLTPVDVTVTVPCSVVRALPPEGGVVLSTAPKKGKDAALAVGQTFTSNTPQAPVGAIMTASTMERHGKRDDAVALLEVTQARAPTSAVAR